jgi:hypothetical protein
MSDNVILDNAKTVLPDELTDNEAGNNSWPGPLAGETYYGLAGDIVRIIEPHTEADSAALLIQFLTALGNIIGRGPHFKAEADEHHLNIFSCLVGETAKGRKGSSLGYIKNIFQSIDESWKQCHQSGLSSGEGLIWAIRDEIVKTEPIRNKKKEIISYQDLVIDQGIDDKRAMVIQSELAATLRVLGRDGNTLSAIIRDAWDGRDLRIMTKNTPAESTQPHISIIGHITKSELTRYLTNTESDNGFANRFLWVCVKRSKLLPEGGKLGDTEKFDAVFNPLIQKLKDVVEFAREIREIQRDDDARTLWCEIYSELSEGRNGLFGAVTARAEAQTMRLACLYALLDLSPVIRLDHLQAAIALWTYCEQSAQYIFGTSLGDPIVDSIKNALDESPKGLTRTEISSNILKRNVEATKIDDALNKLFVSGCAYKETDTTKNGRPSERWFSIKNLKTEST